MMEHNITCIGFIMDGNRRWAQARGLHTLQGHQRGYQKLREVLEWAKECDIHNVIVYAFSTENWNRTKDEVGYLMDLIRTMLTEELETMMKEEVRMRFLGDRTQFPEDIQKRMDEVEERTKHHTKYTLGVAASYGGRAEIVAAANRAIAEGEPVTEEGFRSLLWSADIPDPDLIVRTSGEQRLSNFMTWSSVYSELFFTDTYWPDFGKEEFVRILEEYGNRHRRKGK